MYVLEDVVSDLHIITIIYPFQYLLKMARARPPRFYTESFKNVGGIQGSRPQECPPKTPSRGKFCIIVLYVIGRLTELK